MGKKAKKGGPGDAGVKVSYEEEWRFLSLQVETLERELQVKSSHAEEAMRTEMEVRAKVDQMEEDFKGEQVTTFAVTADMARQYKALQEELIYKINSLETQLTEQKEELDITNHELQELIRDKDEDIEDKDRQIQQLNERMNDMSQEFATMLGGTLELMKTHIKEKLADSPNDEAGTADFQQRLQDYSQKAYNAVTVNAPRGALGDKTDKGDRGDKPGQAALEAGAA
mmetsp:Transcript_20062/g.51297  ORF Transcript_20062/g.51297 Transcript_20062/m.51297 type:complete len:227 (+) Transcript_20062:63-743(+)